MKNTDFFVIAAIVGGILLMVLNRSGPDDEPEPVLYEPEFGYAEDWE